MVVAAAARLRLTPEALPTSRSVVRASTSWWRRDGGQAFSQCKLSQRKTLQDAFVLGSIPPPVPAPVPAPESEAALPCRAGTRGLGHLQAWVTVGQGCLCHRETPHSAPLPPSGEKAEGNA